MFDITAEKTTNLLNKMIDFSALKAKVVANNIANVNTPGFKRLDVSFDKQLTDTVENEESIKEIGFKVKADGGDNAFRNDQNTVNIDKEVSELMQNSIEYEVYVQLMSQKHRLMSQAMRPNF